MRKALIVDDEVYIRKGLRALIERSGSVFTDIKESENGKCALEMLTQERFDLAIIDIRMPHMDGITLMKEISKLDSKPQVIILSGYDDFNYAREAIRYGALDYLLKPVDRIELTDTLKKVEKEIEKLESIHVDKTTLENLFSQLYANELNYILLNKNLTEQSAESILNLIKLDIMNNSYRIALIGAWKNEYREHKSLYLLFGQYVEEYFQQKGINKLIFPDKDGNLVLVVDDTQLDFDFKGLGEYLNEKYADGFFIGVSMQGKGAGDFRKTYMQAREALKYRIIRNKRQIFYYGEIKHETDQPFLLQEKIKKLAEMLGTDRIEEIGKTIHLILDIRNFYERSYSFFEKTVDCINKLIIDFFLKHIPCGNSSLAEDSEYIKDPDHFANLQDYTFSLKNLLMQMNDYMVELKKQYKEKNAIDIAIAWMSENYHRTDLTMTLVANEVSLNYSYFSMAFKERTGMSFISYLKKLRINKAKELLKNRDAKINEIARKVGFQNPRLFTRSFKEEVGVSPVEYSKKLIHAMDI